MTTEQLKELYATGEWICVFRRTDSYEHLRHWMRNPHPTFDKKFEWKLIHKKHSEVLDHVLNGGLVSCHYVNNWKQDLNNFVELYHPNFEYGVIKDKPSELKSCPFCGSNDIDDSVALQNNGYIGTGCMNCGASTECKKDKQEAIDAWNIRTLPKPVERITREELEHTFSCPPTQFEIAMALDILFERIEYLEANQKDK